MPADGNLPGDGFGGMHVVTCQHDGFDAQRMQLGNGLAAAVFHRVGHGKHAMHFLFIGQQDDRLALLFQG